MPWTNISTTINHFDPGGRYRWRIREGKHDEEVYYPTQVTPEHITTDYSSGNTQTVRHGNKAQAEIDENKIVPCSTWEFR